MRRALLSFATLAILCALISQMSAADVPANLQSGNTHTPPTVNNLNATRGGPNKISLSWTMSGHGGYTIQSVTIHRMGHDPAGQTTHLGVVNHWSDRNATPNVKYYYEVCAKDSGHETGCASVYYTLPQ
jgi:hypothetical protein